MTTCIHCTHNNVRYEWHSDRFYLDEPVANFRTDEAFQSDEGTANSTVSPYFSRSALVESLVDSRELEAVIIQTYSLRLSALKNEFPTLLDPVNGPHIPVLITHGDVDIAPSFWPEEQDSKDKEARRRRYRRCARIKQNDSSDEESGLIVLYLSGDRLPEHHRTSYWEEEIELPDCASVVMVQPTVLSEEVAPAPADFAMRGSSEAIAGQKRRKQSMKRTISKGVFHPKVIMLLCRFRLVIVIMTANMTSRGSTVEGSWAQSFLRVPDITSEQLAHDDHQRRDPADARHAQAIKGEVKLSAVNFEESDQLRTLSPEESLRLNDFGLVLFDFLRRQGDDMLRFGGSHGRQRSSEALASFYFSRQPLLWMDNLGLLADRIDDCQGKCLLRRWLSTFNFSAASVQLATTVPGDFEIPCELDDTMLRMEHRRRGVSDVFAFKSCCACCASDCSWSTTCADSRPLQFGQYRIPQILRQLDKTPGINPRSSETSSAMSSERDILIAQQTSIGGNMNGIFLDELANRWMPDIGQFSSRHQTVHHFNSSQSFTTTEKVQVPSSGCERLHILWRCANECAGPSPSFFTPEAFDAMGTRGQDRLFRLKLLPWRVNENIEPHIKTYCRLRTASQPNSSPGRLELAWCLLTSACLSEGAMGFVLKTPPLKQKATTHGRLPSYNTPQSLFEDSGHGAVERPTPESLPVVTYYRSVQVSTEKSTATPFGDICGEVLLPLPYDVGTLEPIVSQPFFHDTAGLGKFVSTRRWFDQSTGLSRRRAAAACELIDSLVGNSTLKGVDSAQPNLSRATLHTCSPPSKVNHSTKAMDASNISLTLPNSSHVGGASIREDSKNDKDNDNDSLPGATHCSDTSIEKIEEPVAEIEIATISRPPLWHETQTSPRNQIKGAFVKVALSRKKSRFLSDSDSD